MILIGRPVPVEVLEKGRPVERKSIPLEILKGERESMVDADQRSDRFGEPFDQPFGESSSRPILPWTRRWRHLDRRFFTAGEIDAQAFQARRGSFSPGVIDADIAIEDWAINGGCQLQLPFEGFVQNRRQERGSLSQPAAMNFGRTYFLQVSVSLIMHHTEGTPEIRRRIPFAPREITPLSEREWLNVEC